MRALLLVVAMNAFGAFVAFSGTIRVDSFSIFFHLLIAAVVLVTLLGSLDYFHGHATHAGEYFALVATSLGLPFEIYELSERFTWVRIAALAVNVASVVYLLVSKRLFGLRGGRAAYEAERHEMSLMEVEDAGTVGDAVAQMADAVDVLLVVGAGRADDRRLTAEHPAHGFRGGAHHRPVALGHRGSHFHQVARL